MINIFKKDIILYGNKMFTKAVEYLYPRLRVLVDTESNSKVVNCWKRCDRENTLIICCGFDWEQMCTELNEHGLVTYKDFIGIKNLIEWLDYYKIEELPLDVLSRIRRNGLVCWGMSEEVEIFRIINPNQKIKYIVDIDNKGIMKWDNISVVDIDKTEIGDEFIIVTHPNFFYIIEGFCKKGMKEGRDFIYCRQCRTVSPSDMFWKMIRSNRVSNFQCSAPFSYSQIAGGGRVNLCCLGLKLEAGNLNEMSFAGVWNSKLAKIIRLSVLFGNYCFCDTNVCPYLEKLKEIPIEDSNIYIKSNSYPQMVNVSIDHTCNLYCDHCRDSVLTATKDEEEIRKFSKIIINEVLPYTKRILMAGNGEVFISKIYRSIIEDENLGHEDLELAILTNGMFFNKKSWDRIKIKHKSVGLSISLDACNKETYEKIRRGGNFDVVKENLEYASILRKQGKIAHFQLNFVVRQDNIKEMGDFVDFGEKLGVDLVRFTQLENWIYTEEEFAEKAVIYNGQMIEKYRSYFDDVRLKKEIVDLRNIKKLL